MCKPMGKFAEKLNLGKSVLPPMVKWWEIQKLYPKCAASSCCFLYTSKTSKRLIRTLGSLSIRNRENLNEKGKKLPKQVT